MTDRAARIALVAPRNMRFSPTDATSIDLYIHEIALASRHRAGITVFAERQAVPFDDVAVSFWEPSARTAAWGALIAGTAPDLVVVHQHLPTAAALARRLRGVPVALVRHNFVKPPRTRLSAWMKRRQLDRLAGIAFVSRCCQEAFRIDWPDIRPPLFVTPNGIDTALWRPECKRQRIVFVGRLAPEKGVLEAAEALARVLPRHPDWDAALILATSGQGGSYRRAVMRALAACGDRVRVFENLSHDEVRRHVVTGAIALAPTQNAEPFGRVAIEALASGAALVATRAGGFVEVVGDAGILLPVPSADGIARALDDLILDPARRMRLAGLGPARVAGRYDLASAGAAFDVMADEILRREDVDETLSEAAVSRGDIGPASPDRSV